MVIDRFQATREGPDLFLRLGDRVVVRVHENGQDDFWWYCIADGTEVMSGVCDSESLAVKRGMDAAIIAETDLLKDEARAQRRRRALIKRS